MADITLPGDDKSAEFRKFQIENELKQILVFENNSIFTLETFAASSKLPLIIIRLPVARTH